MDFMVKSRLKKTFQYFMPYKKVGPVKNASIHAALNMEVRKEGLYVCVYGTQPYDDAEIVVTKQGKESIRNVV